MQIAIRIFFVVFCTKSGIFIYSLYYFTVFSGFLLFFKLYPVRNITPKIMGRRPSICQMVGISPRMKKAKVRVKAGEMECSASAFVMGMRWMDSSQKTLERPISNNPFTKRKMKDVVRFAEEGAGSKIIANKSMKIPERALRTNIIVCELTLARACCAK